MGSQVAWLGPVTSIGTLAVMLVAALLLAGLFGFLYRQEGDRFLGLWCLAWAADSVRYVLALAFSSGVMPLPVLIAHQGVAVISGLFLLGGTFDLARRPIPRLWPILALAGILWVALAGIAGVSFWLLTLPVFGFLGLTYVATGVALMVRPFFPPMGRYMAGGLLLLWGLHKLDYPFVRPDPDLVAWGYLVAAVLALATAFAFLVAFFQRALDRSRSAEGSFHRERRFLGQVLDTSPSGITVVDPQGNMVFANPCAEEILGLPLKEITRRTHNDPHWHITDLDGFPVPDEDLPFNRVMTSGETQTEMVHAIEDAEGNRRILSINGAPIRDEAGRLEAVVFNLEDITRQVSMEAETRQLSQAVEQSADLVLITDTDATIEYVNPAFERVTGYSREEAIGRTPQIIQSGENPDEVYQRLWATIQRGEPFSGTLINRRKDGTLYYEEKTITPLLDERGRITRYLSTGKDITERVRAEEYLQYLATHDALTDLPNRALFLDRVKQHLAQLQRSEYEAAVLILDISRFRVINESIGHALGDRLLQEVAKALQTQLRPGDTLARLGADRFAFLLANLQEGKDAVRVCRRVLGVFAKSFEVNGHEVPVGGRVGGSLYPQDGTEPENLLKRAENALSQAKKGPETGYRFYGEKGAEQVLENRLAMETELRRALDNGEFHVVYQPQVALNTSRVVGAEALLRWESPRFGSVSPGEFIPVLEDLGLIGPVGDWVLQASMREVAEHLKKGLNEGFVLSVNLSPIQLEDPEFPDRVGAWLRELDFPVESLELEVTERLLVEARETVNAGLNRLQEMGIRLVVDDFGVGYASLSYLVRFSLAGLKIDRSFVSPHPDSRTDPIVEAILGLAQGLELQVVAEGVETSTQANWLRNLDCDLGQGFLYAKPMAMDHLSSFLGDSSELMWPKSSSGGEESDNTLRKKEE